MFITCQYFIPRVENEIFTHKKWPNWPNYMIHSMALHRRTCLCSVLNHTIFEWLFNSIFPPVICYFNSRSATWIGYYIFFLYTWCFVDFSLKLCWCDQYLILISLLSECDVYKHLLISIFCELWPRHHEHCEITEYNF